MHRLDCSSEPKAWVLLGRGAGGNAQMISLAKALGWPFEVKQLEFNALNLLPNLFLGTHSVSLAKCRSSKLESPWPDLVIAASRRSAPISRWIRKRSGGLTRLVHLLHTQAPLEHFDLVITTPQFRLPNRSNVLQLTGTLNYIDRSSLDRAAMTWGPRLAALPRPWFGLLVGGNSSSYTLDPGSAERLGREASELALRDKGSLLVTTSPRTPATVVDILQRSLTAPSFIYRWQAGDLANNPYLGLLALADSFIVTIDSASMMLEAVNTGRPVAVFEWPNKGGTGLRAAMPSWPWLERCAVKTGFWKPARNLEAYFSGLQARGLVHRLGDSPPPQRRPLDDLDRAVHRVRTLFFPDPIEEKENDL